MTTFGELIDKAKDEDKNKIKEVMKYTLKKEKKDVIEKEDVLKVKNDLDALNPSTASNSWEAMSIAGWADKYQTFINNTTNVKGGKRKRRKRTRRRKKKTRKRRRKKKTKRRRRKR